MNRFSFSPLRRTVCAVSLALALPAALAPAIIASAAPASPHFALPDAFRC